MLSPAVTVMEDCMLQPFGPAVEALAARDMQPTAYSVAFAFYMGVVSHVQVRVLRTKFSFDAVGNSQL